MSLEHLLQFAKQQEDFLKTYYNFHDDHDRFVLAQTVKLSEEVGELCEQILSYNSLQRQEKMRNTNKRTLSHELADVILTTFILARTLDIDLLTACREKIGIIKKRCQ